MPRIRNIFTYIKQQNNESGFKIYEDTKLSYIFLLIIKRFTVV